MQISMLFFARIEPQNDQMLFQMKQKKAETIYVYGFAGWDLAIFFTGVARGPESELQSNSSKAAGQMRGLI